MPAKGNLRDEFVHGTAWRALRGFLQRGGQRRTAAHPIEEAAAAAEALQKRVDDFNVQQEGSPAHHRRKVSADADLLICARRGAPNGLPALGDEALCEAERAARKQVHVSRRHSFTASLKRNGLL